MQVPDKWWNKFKNKGLEMLPRDPEKENIPFTRTALAMCENIDWNVGRVISWVAGSGLMENKLYPPESRNYTTTQGKGKLKLNTINIAESVVMDFRLIVFKRI